MPKCQFDDCPIPGTETIECRYNIDGQEVNVSMNLCPEHFRTVAGDISGLSIGVTPEPDLVAAFLAWARAGGEPETEWVINRDTAATVARRLELAEAAIDQIATGYPDGAPLDWFVTRAHAARDARHEL